MTGPRINPETWALEGVDLERVYTAAEFARLPHPKCPTCAAPVSYGRIKSDSLGDMTGGWLIGRRICPNGHGPNTDSV